MTLTRITTVPDGPLLVEGPVEVTLPDGSVARSERPVVALCVCRRSRLMPWCDTSHRSKVRTKEAAVNREGDPRATASS